MGQKLTFQISIESQLVIDELGKAKVGDVVTYDKLTRLLGRDVRTVARGSLTTARRRLQKDSGIVFGTVARVGVRRLSNSETVGVGASYIKRVHSTVRRGVHVVGCADYDALGKDDQVKHNTYLSIFGTLGELTKTKQIEVVEKRVADAQCTLPYQKTLDAMRGVKTD